MNTALAGLLEKYKNGTITPAEWQLLREAIGSNNFQSSIQEDILQLLEKGAPAANWKPADAEAILQTILAADEKETAPEPVVYRIYSFKTVWFRSAAAAVILLLGAAGYGWFRYRHPAGSGEVVRVAQPVTILPAGNSAMLTLGDGSRVALDSAGNRLVAAQGGTQVKLNNGQLVYDGLSTAVGGTAASGVLYNTVTTARGNQFHVVLPDGTKVYLNAASSIRYPTVFVGDRRRVEITGEAWLEVAKNAGMPFSVHINKETEIEVLGTSFDVNAYADEKSIEATLVEGSIRVRKGGEATSVKPGEQVRVGGKISLLKNADIDKALAWKNGIFNFEDVGLREMMRQLERWYDIEVEYEQNVPDVKFFGKISRKVDLATVLEALKGFGLHYEMKGPRKLLVKQ